MTQSERILEFLRDGPKSQRELRGASNDTIMNVTDAVSQLRAKKYVIECRECPDGYNRYFLIGKQGVLL